MTMEIYSTKIIEHSGLKYRIEMRKNHGVWEQRHIWYPAPQTYVTSETAEPWIKSAGGPNASMEIVKFPARDKRPQKPMDIGLFSDEAAQLDLVEMLQPPTNEE